MGDFFAATSHHAGGEPLPMFAGNKTATLKKIKRMHCTLDVDEIARNIQNNERCARQLNAHCPGR